jgi:hypothetical protein
LISFPEKLTAEGYPTQEIDLASKILFSIEEVAALTKLPPLLINQYLRMKKRAIAPELLPNINPRYIKGEPFFTQKDIDKLLDFIDKRKDESWNNWQLRMVKEARAKRESEKEHNQPIRPDLQIVHDKNGDKGKT